MGDLEYSQDMLEEIRKLSVKDCKENKEDYYYYDFIDRDTGPKYTYPYPLIDCDANCKKRIKQLSKFF